MCGIVAMFSEGGEVKPDALERATKSLHHRGPDAQRTWLDKGRKVGLGHARLSIIDLEGGAQPLSNEDESIRAVVNGELYDFERLRTQLEKQGHTFRTKSDSEVLVHLYEQKGTSFVEDLRGEFAFVLYDARNDVLIAGRDRFGIKPLHYARFGGVLALASEAKALFAAGMRAQWDEESFPEALLLGGPQEDRTFFKGVLQVAPGHLLIATRGHTRTVRYWDFDFPAEPAKLSEAEQVEAVRAALDEATRLRLRADVPVACYLSGGIDSCTVLGLAQRHSSRPLRAFTLSFEHAEYDEAPIAQEMAKHCGADYTPIPIGQRDFADDFEDAVWHCERPIGNGNSVAKFRLSRAVRDAGIKVVLTGEGSDEIFAGYPHYRRDLFLDQQRKDPSRGQAELKELEQKNAVSRGTLMPDGEGLALNAVRRTLGFAPSWLEAFATAGYKTNAVTTPEVAALITGRDVLAPFMGSFEVARQLSGRHVVHQSMYLWGKTMLPNFILSVLGDRMEMAHSVEGRLPFLDHHVVRLATQLPVSALIRGTVEKHVLREAAKPVITDTVYRRQKHPFLAPPVSSAKGGPLHELMQDTLRGPKLKAMPFFEPQRMVGLLDALPKMDAPTLTAMDTPLMIILSSVLMQERFAMTA
jgi:asparagine synthase (glutamine-hydrolysing)